MLRPLLMMVFIGVMAFPCRADHRSGARVIGYYAGNTVPFDSIALSKLTHIIYCFGRLCDDEFCLRSAADTAAIERLVELKAKFPELKVMLSLGGWGGCATCSEVFSKEEGRRDFAKSVRRICDYFKVDGLDLDWEYPVVNGFPGHRRSPKDKENFTCLLEEIRNSCDKDFLLTFAAGGYSGYIDSAIEWKSVVPLVDFINVMSYDLVHGYSKVSGHHTPLYSTARQVESTDHAVDMLLDADVPPEKIVIGAAFYARVFKIEEGFPVDLYQPCVFENTFQFKSQGEFLSAQKGYEFMFDQVAFAPYAVNLSQRLLVTYDDEKSIAEKTRYVSKRKLGGIMFWQLCDDKAKGGLLDVIHQVIMDE